MNIPLARKPALLIVDDESGPRHALRMVLQPFLSVHLADCAHTALQILRQHPIDLVTSTSSRFISSFPTTKALTCCRKSSWNMKALR